jgi:hypothetical protein
MINKLTPLLAPQGHLCHSWYLSRNSSFGFVSLTSHTESGKRKTITVPDVVFVLNRHGNPIYVRLDHEALSLSF